MVVDRLTAKASSKQRLTDSVETALKLGGGLRRSSSSSTCPRTTRTASASSPSTSPASTHDLSFEELEPRSFSFNSPYGACPECHGLGTQMEVDEELVVPDPGATLAEGALDAVGAAARRRDYFGRLVVVAVRAARLLDGQAVREAARRRCAPRCSTAPTTRSTSRYKNRYGRQRSYYTTFEGVIPYVERRHSEAETDTSRDRWEGFMREVDCPVCKGQRLKPVVARRHRRGPQHRRDRVDADR